MTRTTIRNILLVSLIVTSMAERFTVQGEAGAIVDLSMVQFDNTMSTPTIATDGMTKKEEHQKKIDEKREKQEEREKEKEGNDHQTSHDVGKEQKDIANNHGSTTELAESSTYDTKRDENGKTLDRVKNEQDEAKDDNTGNIDIEHDSLTLMSSKKRTKKMMKKQKRRNSSDSKRKRRKGTARRRHKRAQRRQDDEKLQHGKKTDPPSSSAKKRRKSNRDSDVTTSPTFYPTMSPVWEEEQQEEEDVWGASSLGARSKAQKIVGGLKSRLSAKAGKSMGGWSGGRWPENIDQVYDDDDSVSTDIVDDDDDGDIDAIIDDDDIDDDDDDDDNIDDDDNDDDDDDF